MQEMVKAFLQSVSTSDHQIKSFNDFVENRLQKIIDEVGEIELEIPDIAEFKIKLGKVRLLKPFVIEADGAKREITPSEARLRNLTYASPIFVEMIPSINGVDQEAHEVPIGELPIMVRSKYCTINGLNREELIAAGEDPDDTGGYFIINGTERVIVLMEEVITNRPIIEIRGGIEKARINSEVSGFVQKHTVERRDSAITVSYASVKKMQLVILLRALGLETDEDIINAISKKRREMEEIFFNIVESDVRTKEEAYEYIATRMKVTQKQYKKQRVDDILDKYLLPHIGQVPGVRLEKAHYLAKVARKLLRVSIEGLGEQDIDHYAFKRIKSVGDFMEILLRSLLLGKYGLVSRIVYSYQKLVRRGKMPNIKSIVESEYITKRISSHMATGQWIGGRTGVCQRLERTNIIRTISHLRNVISPLSSTQEHFRARALHPTQWGRLCASETPEGINIGLRKYLAMMATLSDPAQVADQNEIVNIVKKEPEGGWAVFLDGIFVAEVSSPEKLAEKIIGKRRSGALHKHISIGIDKIFEEVNINTDPGRLLRPLIVVEEGKSKLTKKHLADLKEGKINWNDLVEEGIIEYIDAEEENNAMVALYEKDISGKVKYLEVSPVAILGISASLVPFAPHNRGDRVNFGAKMSGQSLGIYSGDFFSRAETKCDVLVYPQVPLVTTTTAHHMGILQGQNIIIAVTSYFGYNMEDAVIFNRASIERGFGRSMFFRTYTTEEKRYFGIERDEIKIPDKSVSGYRTEESYGNLAEDGIINREVEVKAGDVIVGRISPLRFFGPQESSFMMGIENRRETSTVVRYGEEGIVDNVILTETISGERIVKVVVRNDRVPELGDKFASRHGQKGIIGLIVPEEDMPFTSDGIVPDVILNTHAIPSRMTIGQLIEIIAGKVGALTGSFVDVTPFVASTSESALRKTLENLGFSDDGKETMYDGITGQQFEAQILVGPCYFQKLHHMVADKIHARARGPVTLLTKQPTAGRSKQGGLRLGEMEKDCLIAHGTALLLKERFSSDSSKLPVCNSCGLIAVDDKIRGRVHCPVCKKTSVSYVQMSYAFKLMLDELKCMGVLPRIVTEETESEEEAKVAAK
ncbi:MAG: DNA-directed RNA polymerase subunit B [Candidatus Aenigmarchaeota archaeon]|nr:DNA-directed RNA polymerase subunit B [Candidatus Aenigmarchaeota archaeon]